MSEPVNPINPPADDRHPADPTPPPDDGNGAADRSCPEPQTSGQLETRIKEAAKAMQQSEAEVTKAEAEEEQAKVYLEDVRFEALAARANLVGKAFLLGAELDALAKEMEGSKGKHRDTFRKRAIKLLKNKNAVYRPLALYRYLTNMGITSEEEAVLYAGDSGQSYSTLADIAQAAEKQPKAAKKPGGGTAKQVAAKSARKGPKAKAVLKQVDGGPDDDSDEDDEPDDEPELASDEDEDYKRLWARELIFCFDPRNDDPDFERDDPDEPLAPECIQAAVAYLIEKLFPGGWQAAKQWMATRGPEDAEVPEEEFVDDDFDPVKLATVDLTDVEEESLD